MAAELHLVELEALTHAGMVRDHNEDRHLLRPPLMVVADGMGGAQAGEVASGVAVDTIGALPDGVGAEELKEAVIRANREIRRMAEENPRQSGMGTTVTAALLREGGVEVVQVGDSRAYLLRAGALRQITQDHSVVAELVRRGDLSPKEAEQHPRRNVITRALGADAEVRPDTFSVDLVPGDVLALCSDGLCGYVSDDDIARALRDSPTLKRAAERLIELANDAGGPDNITVVLARLGGDADIAVTEEMDTDRRADPTAETVAGSREELGL